MPREFKAYLADIIDAIRKIEKYTKNLSYEKFAADELILDGIVRNLEIIGEAAKRLPEEFRSRHTNIEWNKITGMRNRIVHEYFGVDLDLIWQIINNDLPEFEKGLKEIKKSVSNL